MIQAMELQQHQIIAMRLIQQIQRREIEVELIALI